jgi:hypothetical protein
MVKGCLEATKKHRIYDKISKEFYRKGDVFLNRKERRSKNKEINILEETITIINQYFPELINKFEGLTDTRKQPYVKYKMKVKKQIMNM